MLGKPIVNPVSIEKLLSYQGTHLMLTFEQPAAEIRPWLLEQLKTRSHIPVKEFIEIVRANQAKGAAWCRTNNLGWSAQLNNQNDEPGLPNIPRIKHNN